ncbi:hypothetical protein RFI_02485 [Reticulomyxa filosa]|uniref:Uncharacterized protein n=1 Tax=Reticulomyxa filosa TaxID=46433 RepID=X6P7V3_RETFI|nr:hypothetical protein RFI_02485 [Reticulomyxa filosa]|eukprot:ETO34605.1 hypothetical protein RFI_02485 [Reticulomyxa filosa]
MKLLIIMQCQEYLSEILSAVSKQILTIQNGNVINNAKHWSIFKIRIKNYAKKTINIFYIYKVAEKRITNNYIYSDTKKKRIRCKNQNQCIKNNKASLFICYIIYVFLLFKKLTKIKANKTTRKKYLKFNKERTIFKKTILRHKSTTK